jgi:hypothetical protein
MDEIGNHYVKQNKPDLERQVAHIFSHMWDLGGEKRSRK